MIRSAFIFVFALSLFCINANAKVKQVPTATQIYQNQDGDSASIEFARIVFNVPSTQSLGTLGAGVTFCLGSQPFELESQTFEMNNPMFVNAFNTIAKSANYNIAGDPSALFIQDIKGADYLVAAMITDFEIKLCVSNRDASDTRGELYMKLDWQVFDMKQEKVVFRKETEGYFKQKKTIKNGMAVLLENTFNSALTNLLETDGISKLLASQDVAMRKPNFENIVINYSAVTEKTEKIELANATKSVVTIRTNGGHGSGFIISSDGYVLTNQHVVGESDTVTVSLSNGMEVDGQVLRSAKQRDVALVKIPLSKMPVLPIKLDMQEIGTAVYAIGAPLDTELQGSISSGIVSTYRQFEDSGLPMLQSDTIVNGGNSGGPLVNKNGEVVAITVSKFVGGEGISFFIPIHSAIETLNIQNADGG